MTADVPSTPVVTAGSIQPTTTGDAATPMLRVDDVQTYYGRIQALKGVTLEVAQGEIVTLLGANGAGKTTTLRTVSGLQHPRVGSVWFEGRDISQVAANKLVTQGIGHAPEGRRIFSRLTVLENLQMGAYTRHADEQREDLERVIELFPRLKERLKQLGGTLSGGEQQMLAIGRALMSRPRLLLLDEPSLGLAPLMVERIFETIASLKARGTTILLVEQNALQALGVANRGYVLQTGKVTLADTAAALIANEDVRRVYLGEI